MKYVVLIEDDAKFRSEIVEALTTFDPQLRIKEFPHLDEYAEWIKQLITKGKSLFEDKEPEVRLVISKVEFLGKEHLGLLRKTRDLFIAKGLCSKEDPTGFVLTTFDKSEFNIVDLEDRILNNVIYKPFDRLILSQHLIYAMDGRHPPSKYTVHNQKTSATIEMLKDVPLESLSEVGFVTRNDRPINVGSLAKYYGSLFASDRQRSVFAKAIRCEPHPEYPEEFRCSFSFFGADSNQLNAIRKLAKNPSAEVTNVLASQTPTPHRILNIAVIDADNSQSDNLKSSFLRTFEQINIKTYSNPGEFLTEQLPEEFLKNVQLKRFVNTTDVFDMVVDATGNKLVGFDNVNEKEFTVLGKMPKDILFQSGFLMKGFLEVDKKKLKDLIAGTFEISAENHIFKFHHMNEVYFLELKSAERKRLDKFGGLVFVLRWQELTKEQTIAHLVHEKKTSGAVDAILTHADMLGTQWDGLLQFFAKINTESAAPKVFIYNSKTMTDTNKRHLGPWIEDVFLAPFDRSYLLKRFLLSFPLLKTLEEVHIPSIRFKEQIKVANPIEVTELSEAGLVLKYHRPLPLGSFREFVLWREHEVGTPEIIATCNFVEPDEADKTKQKCHFVFFGMTDAFLKHIRVWIRDNYVHSKQKG
jgi:hypothetical protein